VIPGGPGDPRRRTERRSGDEQTGKWTGHEQGPGGGRTGHERRGEEAGPGGRWGRDREIRGEHDLASEDLAGWARMAGSRLTER
jgi:hypothetical protein